MSVGAINCHSLSLCAVRQQKELLLENVKTPLLQQELKVGFRVLVFLVVSMLANVNLKG